MATSRGCSVSSRPVVAVAATLLALVAGCTQQTTGAPSSGAGGTTDSSLAPPTTESSEPTGTTGEGLADLKPCEVLDDADLAALELTGGEEKDFGGARVCRYRHDGATLNESFTISVELFDSLGLADLNATDIQELPNIGDHEAASSVDPTGGCRVSLGVTETSRIDNTAVGGDQEKACQLATQLATLVERKLP